jgi:hypothetical protein
VGSGQGGCHDIVERATCVGHDSRTIRLLGVPLRRERLSTVQMTHHCSRGVSSSSGGCALLGTLDVDQGL